MIKLVRSDVVFLIFASSLDNPEFKFINPMPEDNTEDKELDRLDVKEERLAIELLGLETCLKVA